MLRYVDSFDHLASGDLTEKWTSNVGMTISAGTGRRGTAGLRQSNVGDHAVSLTLDAQSTWILGFAFRYSQLPAVEGLDPCVLAECYDVGTVQARLKLDFDGSLFVTRGATARLIATTQALHTNVWYYIEWRLVIHASAGETAIRLDGTVAATGAGLNTQNSGASTANHLKLGQLGGSNSTAGTTDMDDVYVCDGQGSGTFTTFLGDCRVDALLPNADGTYAAWTPSAGTAHYPTVDEPTPNDDTDYVSETTAGGRDSYQLEPLPTMPSPEVLAVQACINARKDDVDEILIRPLLVSGGVTAVSSTVHTLTNAYLYALDLWTADPNGGGAWTEAAVNSLQVGMERGA